MYKGERGMDDAGGNLPTARRPPRGQPPEQTGPRPHRTPTLPSTTSVLTATTSVYATGAGITAAAGTRLALQLILTAGFGYGIHRKPFHQQGRAWLPLLVAASPAFADSGQFTRLLPALAVVAVSQAPSPESNPNSPSPVTAIVVQ